jgi:hypothetical protein
VQGAETSSGTSLQVGTVLDEQLDDGGMAFGRRVALKKPLQQQPVKQELKNIAFLNIRLQRSQLNNCWNNS